MPIHVLVWVSLLIIPYASTDQVFSSLDPAYDLKYLLLCFVLSSILIGSFYFNYYFLIPKFLLTEKYWRYIIFLKIPELLEFRVVQCIWPAESIQHDL